MSCRSWLRLFGSALSLLLLLASPAAAVQIPAQSDWVDHGFVIQPGPSGAWDAVLHHVGFSPGAVVRKNGKLMLYYNAADGDRSSDGGPRHRAIGVATCNVVSVDCSQGSNWVKYSGNPVVTYNPNPGHSNSEEEGAWSVAATIDPDTGEVVLYYGGLYAVSSSSVDGEVRVTSSTDGFNFTDDQSVYNPDGSHPSTIDWGCPECAPTGAIVVNGTWYVYTGTGSGWDLGVFWGPSRDNLPNSKLFVDRIDGERISDGGKVVDLDANEFLVQVGHNPTDSRRFKMHRMSKDGDPTTPPAPETEYQTGVGVPPGDPWPVYKHVVTYFDAPNNRWYMFYQPVDPEHRPYGMKTVDVGPPDDTPPSTPQNLDAVAQSENRIDLSWSASSDGESGISNYRVYRDGQLAGQSSTPSFSDSGLSESTSYTYGVSAVNGAGLESGQSEPASATTAPDSTPPSLLSAGTGSDPMRVFVEFSEPVEQASATVSSNYAIDQGVTVAAASLGTDLRTVTLTTSALATGDYTLTVNNVRDRAASPNTIAANSQAEFFYDDSATLEIRIGASADDGEHDGDLNTDSSDLELAQDGGNTQVVGLRFNPLDIPQGAVIHQAWVQFQADEVQSGPMDLIVQGEAADDAAPFGEFAERPRTTGSISWSPPAWTSVGDAGPAQRTPNLSPLLQEIVNRPGWLAGNALAIYISGTGTRTAESWDGASADAPLLHVEFSTAPPTTPPAPPGGLLVMPD